MKIEIKKINKSFKNNKILTDVNMTFESGKIYGLVGKNGSGKSVLLKILCGFYSMDSGKIYLDEQDIFAKYDYLPNARCLIERPDFLPNLSGFKNLSLLASIQNKIKNEDIIDTLKKVNLYNEKDKKFSDYSLGMKQKLGIAQVLMENPKIIILDEPFNGIDTESIIKIRNILLDLKKEDRIIIIATHNQDDLDLLTDTIYYFENGNVKEEKKKDN